MDFFLYQFSDKENNFFVIKKKKRRKKVAREQRVP